MRYRLHLIQQKEVFVSTLQTHLETYLSSDAPALGLEEIALKYNVDPKQYYRYFPELAHQVSQRYLQFKSEKSADDHSLRTETTKRTPRKIDYALVKRSWKKP
jgi:hypothetical protein